MSLAHRTLDIPLDDRISYGRGVIDRLPSVVAGASAFITDDRRIRSRPSLEVWYLDDLVVGDPVP